MGFGAAAVGIGIGAAAVYWVSHTITDTLVKVALNRELPKLPIKTEKAQKMLMGSALDTAWLQEAAVIAEDLQKKVHETVEISAADGVTLVGHLFGCAEPKRLLIAMHGWRSSWAMDFGAIADFWRESGCCVLYAEQRGQNNSGGDCMGFGMLEQHDCAAWAHWAHGRFGGQLPVYLAGISMGATTVLLASELDLPPDVHGIIADCGFTSAEAIWEHVVRKNLHLPYAIRRKAAERLCRKKIGTGPKDCTTTDAMRNNRIPVLFIHGEADDFVPVEMTYENHATCSADKMLLIVPGADHGMSYIVDKEGYERITEAFWHRNDSRAG